MGVIHKEMGEVPKPQTIVQGERLETIVSNKDYLGLE
jgi:hypothetical protein